MEHLIELLIVVVLLAIGLGAGRVAERKHFRSLDERERELGPRFVVTDLRSYPGGVASGSTPLLVSGHACISTDYFKTFIAGLKKIIGGELGTYESLMQRARREAMLRMLESARQAGCDGICNVRLDGFDIGGGSKKAKGGVISVSVLASGTGYRVGDAAVRAMLSGGVSAASGSHEGAGSGAAGGG